MEGMENNGELEFAGNIVRNTGMNLFLTGKAGTGKTTFLRELKEKCPKRMIVLAPTGIAAINAGGMTIHSFFQLPFAPYVPETSFSSGGARYSCTFGKEKLGIIRSIDLLVIDEISMVRADLLDAVDNALRRSRNVSRPFGGVQLLLIGDLQQLPPVARDEDWQMLKEYYDTPYFFSSHAFRRTGYCMIELKKVYRQKDSDFLHLLNSIRENRCGDKDLEMINSRYLPDFRPDKDAGYIRLVTHNYKAQRINRDELDCLPGKTFVFTAEVEGKFPEYSYPTDEELELKEGAQVLFVKNDTSGERRYFNGMLGEVVSLSEDGIEVKSKESGECYSLEKEEWTNARYVLDAQTKEIKEEIEGVFRQYPLKLAWAITIHKSQGLTFDHAVIDAEAAFAHGQAYVALSRCRTLQGLVLSAPLTRRSIISDKAVDDFTDMARKTGPDGSMYDSMRKAYFLEQLTGLFDFSEVSASLKKYVRMAEDAFSGIYPQQMERYRKAVAMWDRDVAEVAGKFRLQYTRMSGQSEDCTADSALQERIRAGAGYFMEKLESAADLFMDTAMTPDSKETGKKLREQVLETETLLYVKTALLRSAAEEGFDIARYLKGKAVIPLDAGRIVRERMKKAAAEAETGGKKRSDGAPSDILHPELYRRLAEWRNAEASSLGVPVYVVIRQKAMIGISNFLPASRKELSAIPYLGKTGIEKYGDRILKIVGGYLRESGGDPSVSE